MLFQRHTWNGKYAPGTPQGKKCSKENHCPRKDINHMGFFLQVTPSRNCFPQEEVIVLYYMDRPIHCNSPCSNAAPPMGFPLHPTEGFWPLEETFVPFALEPNYCPQGWIQHPQITCSSPAWQRWRLPVLFHKPHHPFSP